MNWPEKHRMAGEYGGPGLFAFLMNAEVALMCQASDGMGWEHVSISVKRARKGKMISEMRRCPTWEEMCRVKSIFWGDDETVMQLHPPKSEWVSTHPWCLHLWRPVGLEIPRPPQILVGRPGDDNQG